jgi:hypothetical protein
MCVTTPKMFQPCCGSRGFPLPQFILGMESNVSIGPLNVLDSTHFVTENKS